MALPRIAPYPLPTAAELPTPRGPWRPQRDRIALLVHDMQRYFLAAFDDAAEPLQPAVANIARLLAHCRAHGIPVFYTAQHGDQDRRDRGLQADLWGPGMRRGEEHEAIIEALAP
ncbi:isochorismatase family protein, partial [Stenotrophomonas sp. NPDC077659]|uniref:isochorismatase family protein n=1 Tax=Stenotrophomonas sp. NPDC077659 TaxID=3390694 RepID=UPI003D070693